MTIEQDKYNVLTGQITNDKNKTQQIAILFDYITDESSTVEAEITDNWVESNYSEQDHIAIKPRIYRLKGCVGEVVFENKYLVEDYIEMYLDSHPIFKKTLNAVNGIGNIFNIVSNYTQIAINIAKQLESSFDRYKNIWQNFQNDKQFVNKHQIAVYNTLSQILQTRTPVKLSGLMFSTEVFMENQYDKTYYLQSVTANQTDSKYISDIEVVIKEFRIAKTQTTKIDKKKFGGIVSEQKTTESNNGIAKGNPTTVTPEQIDKVKGSTITKAPPKNIIKKIFWQIEQNTQSYNNSINNMYTYQVDYRK